MVIFNYVEYNDDLEGEGMTIALGMGSPKGVMDEGVKKTACFSIYFTNGQI